MFRVGKAHDPFFRVERVHYSAIVVVQMEIEYVDVGCEAIFVDRFRDRNYSELDLQAKLEKLRG